MYIRPTIVPYLLPLFRCFLSLPVEQITKQSTPCDAALSPPTRTTAQIRVNPTSTHLVPAVRHAAAPADTVTDPAVAVAELENAVDAVAEPELELALEHDADADAADVAAAPANPPSGKNNPQAQADIHAAAAAILHTHAS